MISAVEDEGISAVSASSDTASGASDVSVAAQTILTALGHDPCDIDTLAARTGLDVGELLAELMGLELQGEIEKRAGHIYARLS